MSGLYGRVARERPGVSGLCGISQDWRARFDSLEAGRWGYWASRADDERMREARRSSRQKCNWGKQMNRQDRLVVAVMVGLSLSLCVALSMASVVGVALVLDLAVKAIGT